LLYAFAIFFMPPPTLPQAPLQRQYGIAVAYAGYCAAAAQDAAFD